MTLMMPYGMNSALNDFRSPFGEAAANFVKQARAGADSYAKLERIAKRGELDPHQKAQMIGKAIMSGQLRAGVGPNGGMALEKRAQQRGRFPITSDDPQRARLGRQVGEALTKLSGLPGHPAMAPYVAKIGMPGVGARVRALKAANDANSMPAVSSRNLPMLPGTQGLTISEAAIEVLNSLPDNRVRQSAINALTLRPPASNNDAYRWVQTIVALREQINEMCEQMGLDATALTDLLDRKVEFYDPMVQSAPETNPSPRASVGPTTEDFDEWRDRAEPPATEVDVGPFAGSDRSDSNPDFKLAKFYDAVTGRGAPLTRGEDASLQQLEKYGEIVVKAELGGALKSQILMLNATRKRLGRGTAWRKVMEEPTYAGIVRAVVRSKNLTRSMKGAALALIA